MAGPAPVAFDLDDAGLQQAATDWYGWLLSERRLADHTLEAYVRDLLGFFAFAADHTGAPPTIDSLSAWRAADFRAWLSRHSLPCP